MNRIVSGFIFVAGAAAVLSACGGASHALPNNTHVYAPAPYTGPAQLAAFDWGQTLLQGAVYAGRAQFGSTAVEVEVRLRDERGLMQYAQSVSDPSSPLYRRFLTPRQIADRFGASKSDYAAAARYFAGFGLHVGGWPQREMLLVAGPQAALESAFGTPFAVYRRGGASFVAPARTPHFSTSIPVVAADGLVQIDNIHRLDVPGVPTAFYRGYSPQQIARAFDYSGAYRAGFTGKNINVAIVGTGPIAAEDGRMLSTLFNAPVGTITQMPVTDSGVDAGIAAGGPIPSPSPTASFYPTYPDSPGLQTPPPVTAPCHGARPLCNPEDDEAQLDTQSVASLAPGAATLFYLAYNPNNCGYSGTQEYPSPCPSGSGYAAEGLILWPAELEQIIADDKADIVSLSIGTSEANGLGIDYNAQGQGFATTAFATLAAEGISVFAGSGDRGAYECGVTKCVWYPAGDPNVVSVGGVNACIDDAGRLCGQITAWGDATTSGGNGTFANNIGSGGGISTIFPAPAWQRDITPFDESAPLTMRAQPDISLLADPLTGAAIVTNAPFAGFQALLPWGGTSLAAPQMAAMWALVLQACSETPSCAVASGPFPYRLGNAAPLLYAIAARDGGSRRVFYDVEAGENGAIPPAQATPSPGMTATPASLMPGYHAGPGYDLVTGLGVPFAGHLIQAVTGRAVP